MDDLFAAIVAAGDDRRFHPHPLTAEQAHALAEGYSREDVYLVGVMDDRVIAYGMLRGWDEGYEVPSLGIVVRADVQGHGVGRAMMNALHAAAAAHGARTVRLKVYPDNQAAIALYRKLGYRFGDRDGEQLVGTLALPTGAEARRCDGWRNLGSAKL